MHFVVAYPKRFSTRSSVEGELKSVIVNFDVLCVERHAQIVARTGRNFHLPATKCSKCTKTEKFNVREISRKKYKTQKQHNEI